MAPSPLPRFLATAVLLANLLPGTCVVSLEVRHLGVCKFWVASVPFSQNVVPLCAMALRHKGEQQCRRPLCASMSGRPESLAQFAIQLCDQRRRRAWIDG